MIDHVVCLGVLLHIKLYDVNHVLKLEYGTYTHPVYNKAHNQCFLVEKML